MQLPQGVWWGMGVSVEVWSLCVAPLCAAAQTGVPKSGRKVSIIKTTHSFCKNSKFEKAVCKPKICSRAESGFLNAPCPPRSGGGGRNKVLREARRKFFGPQMRPDLLLFVVFLPDSMQSGGILGNIAKQSAEPHFQHVLLEVIQIGHNSYTGLDWYASCGNKMGNMRDIHNVKWYEKNWKIMLKC